MVFSPCLEPYSKKAGFNQQLSAQKCKNLQKAEVTKIKLP